MPERLAVGVNGVLQKEKSFPFDLILDETIKSNKNNKLNFMMRLWCGSSLIPKRGGLLKEKSFLSKKFWSKKKVNLEKN